MPADVLAFADIVRAELQRAFDQAGATVEGGVTREYVLQYDVGLVTGLRCHVFPLSYLRDSAATRRENFYDAEVVVVVAERYTGVGDPPRQWLDDRVHLVERCVYDVLERVELPLMLGDYWVLDVECTRVYDREALRETKLFWSEVEATFRRVRETKPRTGD